MFLDKFVVNQLLDVLVTLFPLDKVICWTKSSIIAAFHDIYFSELCFPAIILLQVARVADHLKGEKMHVTAGAQAATYVSSKVEEAHDGTH